MQKVILSLSLVGMLFLGACGTSSQTEKANAAPTPTATPTASVSPDANAAATPAAPAAATADAAVNWASTEAYDFGQIPQGKPASYKFEFTNSGDQVLKISNVKPSCGCTAANYTKEEIPAGGTGFVEATYNAAQPGVFNKTVTVRFGDEYKPVMLRLKGEVVAAN